jgi:hypothetical protein
MSSLHEMHELKAKWCDSVRLYVCPSTLNSVKHDGYCLLGYDAVQSGTCLPTF